MSSTINNTVVSNSHMPAAVASQPSGGSPIPDGSNAAPSAPQNLTQIASDISTGLAALMARVPDLMISHPLGKSRLHGTSSIPIPFVSATIAAVEFSSELQAVNKLDLPAAHEAVDFTTAFEVVIKQLQKAAIDLRFTADSKKAAVATEALQIYDIAKGLTRDSSGAPLVTYVDDMKKALNRGSRKKVPPVAPTTPPAVPAPVAPAPPSVSLTATTTSHV